MYAQMSKHTNTHTHTHTNDTDTNSKLDSNNIQFNIHLGATSWRNARCRCLRTENHSSRQRMQLSWKPDLHDLWMKPWQHRWGFDRGTSHCLIESTLFNRELVYVLMTTLFYNMSISIFNLCLNLLLNNSLLIHRVAEASTATPARKWPGTWSSWWTLTSLFLYVYIYIYIYIHM